MARVRAANVSMMILIQSWTAERTDVSDADATADMKVMITAVTFVDSWNCKTLRNSHDDQSDRDDKYLNKCETLLVCSPVDSNIC